MIITTRFEIGDKIWVLHEKKAREVTVKQIMAYAAKVGLLGKIGTGVKYAVAELQPHEHFDETEVGCSRDELVRGL